MLWLAVLALRLDEEGFQNLLCLVLMLGLAVPACTKYCLRMQPLGWF